jgi:hypothetical protein
MSVQKKSTKKVTLPIDFVRKQTDLPKLKLSVTTWNMGNAEPGGIEKIFGSGSEVSRFDIYAVGLQESRYSSDQDCIIHLQNRLKEILKGYIIVKHNRRAQLQLYIFARESISHRIGDVEESIENTGFLHLFPNKVCST